jgi:hypothetical protein
MNIKINSKFCGHVPYQLIFLKGNAALWFYLQDEKCLSIDDATIDE